MLKSNKPVGSETDDDDWGMATRAALPAWRPLKGQADGILEAGRLPATSVSVRARHTLRVAMASSTVDLHKGDATDVFFVLSLDVEEEPIY